jgi:hypothetical protein
MLTHKHGIDGFAIRPLCMQVRRSRSRQYYIVITPRSDGGHRQE